MAEKVEKKRKMLGLFRRKKAKQDTSKTGNKTSTQPPPPSSSTYPTVVRVNSGLAAKNEKKAAAPKVVEEKERAKLKSSWLARRKFFVKMTDQAFELVDADNSGEVDEKELYSGLLLIHLKLGCYAGPAACKPVDRERVHDIFHKMDVDNSGSLDRKEFREVMMILFSNVLMRVVVQWSMTLMIVPLVAQYFLNAIVFLWHAVVSFVQHLDEHSVIFDAIELFLENTRDKIVASSPGFLKSFAGLVDSAVQMVPESVWNTIPLTLLSCVLGCLAVPWMIFKVDDYFQALAQEKVK